MMDSAAVERSSAMLRQLGGHLYRPNETHTVADVEELTHVLQILAQTRGSVLQSVLTLQTENIPLLPPANSFTLESIGRDFTAAINAANETDLVTRGPLELKSPNVFSPQIVLDEEVTLLIHFLCFCQRILIFFCRAYSHFLLEEDVGQREMSISSDQCTFHFLGFGLL
jgi:hypothetical protein